MSIQSNIDYHVQALADRALSAKDPKIVQSILGNLTKSIQDGAVKPYVGIPLVQSINQHLQGLSQQSAMLQAMQQPPQVPPQGSIGSGIMQQAQAETNPGITSAQSNLAPQMATGGIVAFDDGGEVEGYAGGGKVEHYASQGYVAPVDYDPVAQYRAARNLAASEAVRQKYGTPTSEYYGPNVTPIKSPFDAALAYYGNLGDTSNVDTSGAIDTLVKRRQSWMRGQRDPITGEQPVGSKANLTGIPSVLPDAAKPAPEEAKPRPEKPYKPPVEDTTQQATPQAPTEAPAEEDKYDKYLKDLMGKSDKDREGLRQLILGSDSDRAKAKQIDLLTAALQGGFDLMAGTSPYAMQNIGQAGGKFAQNVASITAREEADKQHQITQLVNLGLKGTELDTQLAHLGITAKEAASNAMYRKAMASAIPSEISLRGDQGRLARAQATQLIPAQAEYYRNRKTGAGSTGMGAVTKGSVDLLNTANADFADPKNASILNLMPADLQKGLKYGDPRATAAAQKFVNEYYMNMFGLGEELRKNPKLSIRDVNARTLAARYPAAMTAPE